jgi:hypothetical protein
MTLACKHFVLWVNLKHFATLPYQIKYSLQELLQASGMTGTQAGFLNGFLLLNLSIEVNPRYQRRLAIRAFNFAPGIQESLPRGGIRLQRLELPGWTASVCGCAGMQVFRRRLQNCPWQECEREKAPHFWPVKSRSVQPKLSHLTPRKAGSRSQTCARLLSADCIPGSSLSS